MNWTFALWFWKEIYSFWSWRYFSRDKTAG